MPAREHNVAVEARLLVVVVRREDRFGRTGDYPRRVLRVHEQRAHGVLAFGVDSVVELEPTFTDAKRNTARARPYPVPHSGTGQRKRPMATPAHEVIRKCDPDSEHTSKGRRHGTGQCYVAVLHAA